MQLLILLMLGGASAYAQSELRFALHHEPKTLNPLLASEDAAETVRYLTSGSLIRVNRLTQEPEPDLALSWKIAPGNRSITFRLRPGSVTAADIVNTFDQLASSTSHPPAADMFPEPKVTVISPAEVKVSFGAPVSGMERLFDQLPVGLGAFTIFSNQPGVEILLKRNPKYWKQPRLDMIRISIQQNREIELNRFWKGELDLINRIDPESYDKLAKETPAAARDNGPSSDVEFFWFNLAPSSPAPQYKKDWFQSSVFRQAISRAINRDDLCRVVYRGHARPAVGPFSPANKVWFDAKLAPHQFDPASALKLLEGAGFQKKGTMLVDKAGHEVEFSVVTNAGNKVRERMAALIQQDLQTIGIKLNIVTLDMPSLIERLTKSSQYEACMLGLTNVDPDPNEMMNVLLSSGRQHAWNPAQKTPATPWEAEIDTLLHAQEAAPNRAKRIDLFCQVQQIMRREEPYIYLVNPNSLSAISPRVQGAKPAALFPETFWNIEQLSLK